MRDFVAGEMARQRIPGLALAVRHHGGETRSEGYGLASVELGALVSAATIFQTGSIAKQLTAAAVLLLVEDGKLDLDAPVSRYLPDVPAQWRTVTVRQLLGHTGGVPDYGPPAVDFRADYSEAELVRIILQAPPAFPPGTSWSYSNSGYVVLGALIGKLAGGAHWSAFMAQRIFGPAGMTSARLISEADIVAGRAAGYRIDQGALRNQEWVSPALNSTADGSLYASVLDLARWDAMLDGDRLLSAASKRLLWDPVALGRGRHAAYGFGWSISDQRGYLLLEHSGHWQGFSAHLARYPENGVTVIVMCNLAFAQVRRIAHGIAGQEVAALALPEPSSVARDPVAGREQRFRAVLQAWAESKPLPHTIPGMTPMPPPPGAEFSRQRVGERLAQGRAFGWLASDDLRHRHLRRNDADIAEVVHYGLVTPADAYRYDFYLDGEGRIADFAAEEW
jgi:CubicO group peptidase (beta-lactamase class C family)